MLEFLSWSVYQSFEIVFFLIISTACTDGLKGKINLNALRDNEIEGSKILPMFHADHYYLIDRNPIRTHCVYRWVKGYS